MRKKISIINFIFLLFLSESIAQRIGEWSSFLPYQSGISITQSNSKIYYGTEWSILQIDKDDFSTERISKVDGLSDIGIQKIGFDHEHEQLVIVYTNGNIDILRGDDVVNLPNIKLNTDLIGTKSINDIYISDGTIFLSTGFGLVTITGNDLLFGATVFTDIPVNDAVTFENKIYISTEEGVFYAPLDGSQNLIDFSLWKLLGEDIGLSEFYHSTGVVEFSNKLFFVADDVVYSLTEGSVKEIYNATSSASTIGFLSAEGNDLMMGVIGNNGRGEVIFYDGENFSQSGSACNDQVRDALQDESQRVWYADVFRGFRMAESKNENCQRLKFDSPYSHEVSDISIRGDDLFVASGGTKDNYDYSFSRSGYYHLSDNKWRNFNQDTESFIEDNSLLNFLSILPHPSKPEIYMGTYWGGLLKYEEETEQYTLYNDTNSGLLGTLGDPQRERVTGILFDSEENLWVTSFGSSRPLALMTTENEWFNFNVGTNKNITAITQDEFGHLWMPVFGNNGGCYVYDPGDNLQSSQDDRVRYISSSNSEIMTNIINSVVVDLDGAVWIGTAAGPVIFDCGSDPFDVTSCTGDRIKVVQDSIVAFLLADQEILSIEIDGANQKWLGSRNGIFVQSPDGEEEIYRFTSENSPLFDNRIRDLEFNMESGNMLIGTDKGLQSFKTPSTEGQRVHVDSKILVYPNPVEPNYDGPIAVKGLVRDAFVQITDVNGNLVTELRAKGGQTIWDGRDMNGNEVATGVYLIFSSNDLVFESPDSYVTKVMIIR